MPKFRKILSDLNPLTLPAVQRYGKLGFYAFGAGCITYSAVEHIVYSGKVEHIVPLGIVGGVSIAFEIADTIHYRKKHRLDTD